MSLQRNYYEVLGIPPGATTDQIKKKYRELARKFHPDVVQDKALGQRVFSQINQAYRVLADPERRAQYNSTLAYSTLGNAPQNGVVMPTPAATPQPAPTPPGAPLPLSAQKKQVAQEFLGNAENAIMGGKPIEARQLCVKVLEIDPRNVRAMELLGDALLQMGRREEAAVQFRNALQAAPSSLIQAKLNRAMQAGANGQNGSGQNGSGQNGSGPTRTVLPKANGADTEKPGGLFGRILGRK